MKFIWKNLLLNLLDENVSAGYAVDIDADGKVTKSAGPDAAGIVKVTGTTGQTRDIYLQGSVVDGFTGKTPNDVAYVHTDGSLTTTPNSYPFGRFISATELLITKDVI